jgi:hypothetical protein
MLGSTHDADLERHADTWRQAKEVRCAQDAAAPAAAAEGVRRRSLIARLLARRPGARQGGFTFSERASDGTSQ